MTVPFHPDESTYLYMSSDWETLWVHPASLAYHPGEAINLKTHYRLIDPPLARYLVGVSRSILQIPALQADWDWSLSWEENSSRGALPDEILLFIGRLPTVLFFPFSLLLIYLVAEKVFSKPAGWAALFLFATNSLILLHTRRAMAEAPLLFFSLLGLWIILRYPGRSWLSAIPLALAFNAKYSAAPLILVGVINIFWQPHFSPFKKKLENLGLFLLLFGGISFLLNPVLWVDPFQTLQVALLERQSLVLEQVAAIGSIRPDLVSGGWWNRVQFFVVHLFFAPLAIQDIGNYAINLQSATVAYTTNLLNRLWNGLVPGSILLSFTLSGFFISGRKDGSSSRISHGKSILSLFTLLQFLGLSFLLSLPFQRYVLPIVPLVCIWGGAGITRIFILLKSRLTKKTA